MSKLNELINELCPDGVVLKPLFKLVTINTPSIKILSKNILITGDYPVINQGSDYISGYTNDKTALFPKNEYIIFGDHTEIIKYVDFPFAQGADGIKILTSKNINCKYLYYCFVNFYKTTGKYTRHWSAAKNTLIPFPPLPVQEEIVRILDNFTELTAELTARKKQYEYYRDSLLTFGDDVERKPLREIATIIRGGNFQKKDFTEKGIPCIHYGQIYTRYGLSATKTITFIDGDVAKKSKFANTNDIIMAVTSENIEDVCKCVVWLGEEKVAISGHTAIIKHNQNAKFLAYYFHTAMFFKDKKKLAHGTKVIEVTPSKLGDIIVPLPSLSEQQRIVDILDRFDTLCNDISKGLPAEIAERQKQYEYYRNKLLTFKNINAEV